MKILVLMAVAILAMADVGTTAPNGDIIIVSPTGPTIITSGN